MASVACPSSRGSGAAAPYSLTYTLPKQSVVPHWKCFGTKCFAPHETSQAVVPEHVSFFRSYFSERSYLHIALMNTTLDNPDQAGTS